MKIYDIFFQDILQASLLYGYETWVLTKPMFKYLEGLCIVFRRGIVQMSHRRETEGVWVYLHLEDVLGVRLQSVFRGRYSFKELITNIIIAQT